MAIEPPNRMRKLTAVAALASAVLFVKVLLAILYEYRWYFPADFNSAFLSGRQESFVGLYRAAFYTHIISGPIALVLGAFLILSGGQSRSHRFHRRAGRLQMAILFVALVPSGVVMASQAQAGPIAAYGFTLLSLATAGCAAAAVYCITTGQIDHHQRWAARCFVLLCSPLLLRLMSGAVIVMQRESDWFYRANAWISWLLPLAIYEIWWRFSDRDRSCLRLRQNPSPPQEAFHASS